MSVQYDKQKENPLKPMHYEKITNEQLTKLAKSDIKFEAKKVDNSILIKFDKSAQKAVENLLKANTNSQLR